MKKAIYTLAALFIEIIAAQANPVSSYLAKQVAEHYIQQNARMNAVNLSLIYTEKSSSGQADYYVFDINTGSGFIIVSAEDAGHPVIGYSTQGAYKIPSAASNPNFNFWMQKRKIEIEYMRDNNMQADAEITTEWTSYANNKFIALQTMSIEHLPLCQTGWGINCDTIGCAAAIAMAQIMKFWNYPAQSCISSISYNWANMNSSACNADIKKLMYECRVSLGSACASAKACDYGLGQPSSEYSYHVCFGYKAEPFLHCEDQANYSTVQFIQLLEAEFAAGRPTQYKGVDAVAGAFTWVCDGNDASDNMHMNWGVNGIDNGYYAITNLHPPTLGYIFTQQLGALMGIEPLTTAVGENISSEEFNIYPNPTSGAFNVQMSKYENVQIKIYDVLGKCIYQHIGISSHLQIDLSSQPGGIYFLQLKTIEGTAVKKIIISH